MQLSLKKKLALEAYRLYRHNEIKAHPLTYFFWECTLRCNLHCLHCGSDCVKDAIPDMPREDFMNVLDKLAPHIDSMRETLAAVMGISPARVSVKATTTERLGFVGRREGCEVWAIVLIERK